MKWIGQSLVDFIARFRSDVYLDDISTGTIASGGNLGLDSNNKVVKADPGDALSFDGSTANGVLTYKDADEISVEANLTFDGSVLEITGDLTVTGGDIVLGAADGTSSTIKRLSNASGSAGAAFFIYGANAVGTNIAGGPIANFAGLGTGTGTPGYHTWYGGAKTTSGSSAQTMTPLMLIQHDYISTGVSSFRLYNGLVYGSDWFAIDVAADAATTLSTFNTGGGAHFEVDADGDITLDSAGQIKLEPVAGNNILLDGTLTVDAGVVIPVATAHDAAGTAISIGAGATTAGTTNNIAGGALTIHGGQGKGSGAGGDIVFKTANASGSGSTLNSLATALTISDDLSATFAGTIVGDVTGDVTGDLTGEADTVATITGLAPDTATTQATQANITTLAGVTAMGTAANTLVVTNDVARFDSANANDPLVIIKNTANDATSGRLRFLNARGADGQDDDECGIIEFYSYDDGTPSGEQYARIKATIDDATSGQESGKLEFQVASHDGGDETGLTLTGGSVDAEVDVTVGLGAASVTTISGDLTVTGDTLIFDSQIGRRDCFEFKGYGVSDGTNYEMADILSDTAGHSPFNHNVSTGSDGLTAMATTSIIRGGGIVMPHAGVLKKFHGWIANQSANTVDLGIFKFTPVDNNASAVSAVLLINTQIDGVNNSTMRSFSEASFDVTFAAGDILYSAVKGAVTGKLFYFLSTLEVEWT